MNELSPAPSEQPSASLLGLINPIRAIEAISAALLLGLIVLMLSGVVLRYGFHRPLTFSDELSSMMFIWLSMLGAAIAIHRSEHLRFTLIVDSLSGNRKDFVETLGNVLSATFLLAILPGAYNFMHDQSFLTTMELGISAAWRASALVIGPAFMLGVMVYRLARTATLTNLLASVAIVVLAGAALWMLRGEFASLGQISLAILLGGVLVVCLFLGVPIGFCFGLAALAFITFSTHIPTSIVINRMNEGMSSLVLLSLPVFILLGYILDETGMGKAIVDVLVSLVGHAKGGMSYVLLGSLFLVSGISGAKVSDMATVAPALFPEMKRRGSDPRDMVALLSAGVIMADTVPPSIVLIVLGSVAGVSIAALFVSGFTVALWLLLVLAIAARWKARHEVFVGERSSLATIGRLLLIAAPALLMPFIIRGAVVEGVATATEVSTVAVVYAFVIGHFIYGGVSARKAYRMLVGTAVFSGVVLLILGTASATAWALTQSGFGRTLNDLMVSLPGGRVTFLLVSVGVFVVVGCLLEGMAAIVLLVPLMFPIAATLNIDLVHYAMVAVVAMNIGLFIPPVGIGFYLACGFGHIAPSEALRAIWFYLFALCAALILMLFIPGIATAWL